MQAVLLSSEFVFNHKGNLIQCYSAVIIVINSVIIFRLAEKYIWNMPRSLVATAMLLALHYGNFRFAECELYK
jgi:hypothetical protein